MFPSFVVYQTQLWFPAPYNCGISLGKVSLNCGSQNTMVYQPQNWETSIAHLNTSFQYSLTKLTSCRGIPIWSHTCWASSLSTSDEHRPTSFVWSQFFMKTPCTSKPEIIVRLMGFNILMSLLVKQGNAGIVKGKSHEGCQISLKW